MTTFWYDLNTRLHFGMTTKRDYMSVTAQSFKTIEPVYNFKLIFTTLLILAHPWYFGCSKDLVQIN